MIKRILGDTLRLIGSPCAHAIEYAYTNMEGGAPIRAWAGVIGALITLPLAPFVFVGQSILSKCDQEDFDIATSALPRISLPEEYAHIEEDGGEFFVWPFCIEGKANFGVFSSLKEAKQFLWSSGYHEVVSIDALNHEWGTFWVRGD